MATSIGWGHAQIAADWSTQVEPLTAAGTTYTVTTARQLAWLAHQVNKGATTLKDTLIVLGQDIDLGGYNWVPIGTDTLHYFSGSFDGQGHQITNMTVDIQTESSQAFGGLIGLMAKGGDIQNIAIVSGSVSVTAKNAALAGAIVAQMENSGSILHCSSSINVTTEITDPADSKKNSPRSGGIVGNYSNSPRTGNEFIQYCYSTGQIKALGTQAATSNGILAGGIAGRLEDVTVENCYSTGSIHTEGGDNPYSGGIAGQSSYRTFIKNCYSSSDVTAISTRAASCYAIAGGISGMSSRAKIENCYATGAILAENRQVTTDGSEVYAGGIVGDLFIGGDIGGGTIWESSVHNCLALNKSLATLTNRPSSRTCCSQIVGGYNTNQTNTSLENNYASIATLVNNASVVTGSAIDLNGANWTAGQLITGATPVFTNDNGWLPVDGKLPVLKAGVSSQDALGGAEGLATAPFLPASITVATAEDFTAALALDNLTSIQLADGTYSLSQPVVLEKPIAISGSSSEACTLKTTWSIAPTTQADIKLEKLTLTEEESNTQTDLAMIGITRPVNLTLRNIVITPQQPGSNNRRAMIGLTETVTSSEITLDNTTIYLTQNNHIGLYNQGALCNFTMTNSRITSKENVNNLSGIRGLITQGAEGCTYNIIDRSTVSVGDNFHYAIWTQTPRQHFVINNSDIYGWAAFYMQGAHREGGADEMTLTAAHSTFTGVGKEGPSNGFGVIVFEATAHSTLEFDDCTITNKITDNTKDYGFIPPFVFQMGGAGSVTDRLSLKPSSDCRVTLKSCTVQNQAEKTTPVFVYYGNVFGDSINGYFDYNKNKITADAATRFLNQDNTPSFLIQNKDTVRNATYSLPHAIAYQNGKNVIPVAYPGDAIPATETTMENAVSLLNAADALPAGYTLPDSILIRCKDGHLATGETAAQAYAIQSPGISVFRLKKESDVFTLQAVVTPRLTITADTVWADNTHANRSVWIKSGTTLTLETALPLDTVFMEKGAQLHTQEDATAQALQLIDTIPTRRWEAFGFPVGAAANMEITDCRNNAVTVQPDHTQDGIWFAGFATAPAFAYKAAFETAGLIAADKDSILKITSKEAVSLKEKAEPDAPTGSSAFTLLANPNTADLALSQTAYVLSADGDCFERKENPVIPAFGCFVLADAQTTATLRSLGFKGEILTANEVVPTDGYYVATYPGHLAIHTAKPVQILITNIKGQVFYQGTVTTGAWQLALPSGIYSVNGQLFNVK